MIIKSVRVYRNTDAGSVVAFGRADLIDEVTGRPWSVPSIKIGKNGGLNNLYVSFPLYVYSEMSSEFLDKLCTKVLSEYKKIK